MQRTTLETVRFFACLEQKRAEEVNCRAIRFAYQRAKPNGSKWGDWKYHGVADQFLMSCKNLK